MLSIDRIKIIIPKTAKMFMESAHIFGTVISENLSKTGRVILVYESISQVKIAETMP